MADQDGVFCKTCGRARRTNDFGRCTVCGETIAQAGRRRASLLGALVWNNAGLVLLLVATAAILAVAVHITRAMPSGGVLSEHAARLLREEPWLKPVLVVAVIAGVAAIERLARRR